MADLEVRAREGKGTWIRSWLGTLLLGFSGGVFWGLHALWYL